MNKRKFRTYLCGPIGLRIIENAREWRELAKESFEQLGIETLNPFDNIGNTLNDVRKNLQEASDRGDVEACRFIVGKYFIPPDLAMVKRCDFITMYIPIKNGYEICGSYGEITLARFLDKPVYIVTDRQMKPVGLPHWAVGCSTEIFKSWDEYYKFIKREYCDGLP